MAELALAFDILAKDKASKEFEKVAKAVKKTTDEVSKDSEDSAEKVKKSYKKISDSSDKAAKKAPEFGGAMKAGMATAVGAVVAGAAAIGAAFVGAMDTEAAKKKLSAGLGLSESESARIGGVAGKLYAQAYGDSMSDVTGAVGAVMSSIEGASKLPTGALEDLTARAMDYAAVFDVDISRAAQVAGQAVKTGLADNATEAFDLLTAASQKVPAALREDILDAVDEYGPMFAQLGFDGPQAFAALVKGADKGQYGIDKTGDALKEFTIRATDMSKTSVGAFQDLGLDAEVMADMILAGGDTAGTAMQEIVDGLLAMEDPSKRANTAIALFGTPLEDLGTEGIPAFLQSLSDTGEGLGDIEGSTKKAGDALNDNLGTKLKTITREFSERLQPAMGAVIDFVTDKVLPGVDNLTAAWENGEGPMGDARDLFERMGEVMQEKVFPALEKVATFVKEEVAPVLKDFGERVIKPIFYGVVIPAFEKVGWVLENVVGPILVWLWREVWAPTFKNIGDAVSNFGSHWATIWSGIQQAAAKPVNFVIGTIWNDGLRKVINAVTGLFGGKAMGAIPLVSWGSTSRGSTGGKTLNSAFANGGYTGDGGKWDPAGIVHAGEYVLTKEEVQLAGGWRALESMKSQLLGYANGGYVRPVPQGSSGWNGGRYRSGKWHGGLDFPAPIGQDISALTGGRVTRALRLNRSYGHHAIIDHGGGMQTLYAHMSRLLASVGQVVAAGTHIGDVGSTGNSTGPHLHFEVRRGGQQVDPTPYLTGAAKGGVPGFGLLDIPKMIGDVVKNLGQLSGPWGGMLKDSFGGLIGQVKDWALGKLGIPGYAGGTNWAAPGLAWVGERGPELVRMRGGEQVIPTHEIGGKTVNITVTAPRDAFRDINAFLGFIGDLEHRAQLQGA